MTRRRRKKSTAPLVSLLFVGCILAGGLLPLLGLPWWTILPAAVLAGIFFPLPAGRGFLLAWLLGLILWGGLAMWHDLRNDGLLSSKVAQIFQLSPGLYMAIITGLLGGLLAGFGALTGRYAMTMRGTRKRRY